MAPIALPPSPPISSSPLPSTSSSSSTRQNASNQNQNPPHDEAHTFSWFDTLNIAITSCTPSLQSVSTYMPCLRSVPSDDSLNQRLNHSSRPQPTSTRVHGRGGMGPRRVDTNWTPNADGSSIPRARPDELQGLLASASSDDDDAHERLSLHSNLGVGRRNRRRRKEKKPFTLFGYDVFNAKGRAKAVPITLAGEDEALYETSALAGPSRSRDREIGEEQDGGGEDGRTTSTSLSLGTITIFDADSDAAPLSATAIDELSADPSSFLAHSAQLEALREQEAEARRLEKEERRRRRREKKKLSSSSGGKESSKDVRDRLERERLKLERAKMQGVLPEDADGEEFEGFQGSGGALPVANVLLERKGRARSGTTTTSSSSASGSGLRSNSRSATGSGSHSRTRSATLTSPPPSSLHTPKYQSDDFGDFVSVSRDTPQDVRVEAAEDEDAVDLDGGLYSGATRRPYSEKRRASASRSGGGSDSLGAGGGGGGDGSQPSSGGLQHRRALSKSTSSSRASQPNAPASPSPLGPLSPAYNPLNAPSSSTGKSHKKAKASAKKSSRSSGSTAQSSPSPLSPSFPSNSSEYVSPSTVEQGLGFFDAEDFVVPASGVPSNPASSFAQGEVPQGSSPSGGREEAHVDRQREKEGSAEREKETGFPSTGFGNRRAGERRDMVRFLSSGSGGL